MNVIRYGFEMVRKINGADEEERACKNKSKRKDVICSCEPSLKS